MNLQYFRIMKKKILFFHPALAPYRVDFFNAIHKEFNAVFYFTFLNVANQKFAQDVLTQKCNFKCNYILNGFELFGRSVRIGLGSIIKKEKPEIIICSEYGYISIIVFIIKYFLGGNFKLYILSDDSVSISKSSNKIRSLLRNIISKNIDGIILPSIEVCNWVKKNISNKIKTLELPIIHNEYVFRLELKESIKIANLNISKYKLFDKKVILFIGRLVEVKNLFFLIKAIARLKSNDWNLIIVGDGALMDYLKNFARDLNIIDKIHFIGRQEGLELYSWYTFAQIFILPSTYEPFGAVVNEALLGGCKVLCSELAGASSLIKGDNGMLFNPYHENELLTSIEKALGVVKPNCAFINRIRDNAMPFTFEEKINRLMVEL